jgi:solute carrier family 25 S-adenosylmethionine transporter 26
VSRHRGIRIVLLDIVKLLRPAADVSQLSCLVRVPTEIIKSRTQTGAYGHGKGKGSINSALSTLRYDGPKGFFRGFGMTIARDVSGFVP